MFSESESENGKERRLRIWRRCKMQVKTKMRYHLTPVTMATIKKIYKITTTNDNECWQSCGEKGSLVHPLMLVQNVAAAMENNMESPQKLKTAILWFSNITPRYSSQRIKIRISKRHLYSHVYCKSIQNSQNMEATQVFINRWMDKDNIVYTYKISS